MSEHLTPDNQALMDANPLQILSNRLNHGYTLKPQEILTWILKATETLVIAEEYGHPVLSQSEAIRQARENLILGIDALKLATIYAVKQERGDWIATA